MGIRVIKAGLLTTIQDRGRHGWQAYGFIVGGAMDQWSMRLANIAVGNDQHEAVIEMTMVGADFEFQDELLLCFCGADMQATLNDKPVYNGKPFTVKKNDRLCFKNAIKGCRTYLAVKGSFHLPDVLGSKSTYLNAGIGGYEGRKLEAGDILNVRKVSTFLTPNWHYNPHLFLQKSSTIRFIEGRQFHWFLAQSQEQFETIEFTVDSQSDRMGYRLTGPSIETKEKRQLITEGTTFGTIQIPPNGQPIVLMADRQPTGGYPKIGKVITADLSKLAQCKPGDKIRFQKVTVQEAQHILRQYEMTLKILEKTVKEKTNV